MKGYWQLLYPCNQQYLPKDTKYSTTFVLEGEQWELNMLNEEPGEIEHSGTEWKAQWYDITLPLTIGCILSIGYSVLLHLFQKKLSLKPEKVILRWRKKNRKTGKRKSVMCRRKLFEFQWRSYWQNTKFSRNCPISHRSLLTKSWFFKYTVIVTFSTKCFYPINSWQPHERNTVLFRFCQFPLTWLRVQTVFKKICEIAHV